VRFVSGNKILRIMKAMGLAPDLPEDLYYLIKKAVAIRKHLERNRYYKTLMWDYMILIHKRSHANRPCCLISDTFLAFFPS